MDMSMGNQSMTQTFGVNGNAPLWLAAFAPTTEARYIGSIVGLILLGIANRGISAAKWVWIWYTFEQHKTPQKATKSQDSRLQPGKNGAGINEQITKDKEKDSEDSRPGSPPSIIRSTQTPSISKLEPPNSPPIPPFKWQNDVPRTILAVLEAFTGYLLMLAIMTFDAGYFFAVLGGIMIGELVFGRYVLGASVAGHIH
ncbi:hypothetical protein BZG36_02533 [Bifiguratus adelaidae]|uniref:Copper transport protein n=1 Tax=Bifiguratus adelaidae TaxID=1938954 RepID=A0A261Y257_9FUNG|nr:hypothetical protein BZG36_02533 [Bifiguratus adelaidae]